MFKRLVISLALLLVLVIAAAAAFNYIYQSMLEPVGPAAADEYKVVEVPSGATTENIAGILKNEDLIQNELAFRYYVRSQDLGSGFQAGTYQFSPAMSVQQIAEKITAGDVFTETKWFTIPEGYTIERMAERLEEERLVDINIFLELAASPPDYILANFPYLQGIDDPDIDYLLEGYLYPDTYQIDLDAGEEEIIKLMLNTLDEIITEERKQRAEELGLSIHEILTIASLVEREAAVDHERDVIAGVIYNRLAIGQLLQIDATIQYILGETKEFLTYADLEVPSPYNTYQHAGLPPGPIAAPGKPSVDAALFPEDNDYYYYNYKYDDTGEHYFSHTLEEHLNNVRRAEENLQ